MKLFKDRRPSIACEFGAEQIVAGKLGARGAIEACALQALPPGALVPSFTETNIVSRPAVCTAIRTTVAELGHGRDVTLILPDAGCRIVLIDTDVLPEKAEEADVFVRLRLRRSFPFDLEKACVSWQAQNVNGKVSLIAAVALHAIVEEYESAAREAGCSPGLVLPSILAALGQVTSSEPALLIKVDPTSISLAIVHHQAVLLIRVLDRVAGGDDAQLASAVYHSLAFVQDVYGTRVERILIGGAAGIEQINLLFEAPIGLRGQALVAAEMLPEAHRARSGLLGGVVGALV
jgi:Tfp pilus assembly PilM family ATPase